MQRRPQQRPEDCVGLGEHFRELLRIVKDFNLLPLVGHMVRFLATLPLEA